MNLSEYYLLKSFKYIRREWRNGRWRYWYENTRGKFVEGRWGKILKEYVGDPRQAFKRLFKDKGGQAYDVVTLKLPALDIDKDGKIYDVTQTDGKPLVIDTPIDLIWGNNSYGIRHILKRHYVEQNDFESIEEVENTIAMNLIAFSKRPDLFNAEFDSDTNSFEILNRKKEKFIIRVEKDVDVYGVEAIRCYVLTSYDNSVSKNAKKITDSEEKEYRREQINRTKY